MFKYRHDLIVYGNDLEVFSGIFDPKSRAVMVGFFDDENTPECKAFVNFAEEVGISGPVAFYASKVSYKVHDFAEFIGATDDKSVLIVKGYPDISLKRFRLEGKLNESNLRLFYEGFLNGTIPEYVKSQKEPTNNIGQIQTITGNTFRTLVPTKSKYLVLAVVDQDCIVCKGVISALTQVLVYFRNCGKGARIQSKSRFRLNRPLFQRS